MRHEPTFYFDYNAITKLKLMAGRSPKDDTPRNTSVVQVCLPKDQAKRLKQVAKASEHKTVSVWLRAQLQELLQPN